jgi:hypothetical protein
VGVRRAAPSPASIPGRSLALGDRQKVVGAGEKGGGKPLRPLQRALHLRLEIAGEEPVAAGRQDSKGLEGALEEALGIGGRLAFRASRQIAARSGAGTAAGLRLGRPLARASQVRRKAAKAAA